MSDITHLPVNKKNLTADEVLAIARKRGYRRVVVMGENDEGIFIGSAGGSDSELYWLIKQAELAFLGI
jgi:predicted RNA-binding protein with PUA domain